MTHLVWTEEAVEDLEAIRDYVARDSLRYSRLVVERIIESAERIAAYPESGRVVPEVGRKDFREVIVGSYRVVYRLHEDAAQILTIFRASRLFPDSDLQTDKS